MDNINNELNPVAAPVERNDCNGPAATLVIGGILSVTKNPANPFDSIAVCRASSNAQWANAADLMAIPWL